MSTPAALIVTIVPAHRADFFRRAVRLVESISRIGARRSIGLAGLTIGLHHIRSFVHERSMMLVCEVQGPRQFCLQPRPGATTDPRYCRSRL